jgi:hypothetical protein
VQPHLAVIPNNFATIRSLAIDRIRLA